MARSRRSSSAHSILKMRSQPGTSGSSFRPVDSVEAHAARTHASIPASAAVRDTLLREEPAIDRDVALETKLGEGIAHQGLLAARILSHHGGMDMTGIPFGTTDWSTIAPTEHAGETGKAIWRTREFGGIRVRMVEYSPGYRADHWCSKGHILLCLAGELHTELHDGRTFRLTPGTSYQVADAAEAHRSSTAVGARLFIVD
jgi:hypothetical protein